MERDDFRKDDKHDDDDALKSGASIKGGRTESPRLATPHNCHHTGGSRRQFPTTSPYLVSGPGPITSHRCQRHPSALLDFVKGSLPFVRLALRRKLLVAACFTDIIIIACYAD
uniref:Uncharacterized protein n=1 Tax=Coccidioides posadasii RMSCC 3488 TaxID=454284 RepID=A0A0J6FCL6_COCPO|nr:hypothetical protein CPAG_07066 [Coccidioides posadasii RMSCC 3488]